MEHIMEGLMNRIVAKPNLVADEDLHKRMGNILNVPAF